MIPPAFDYETPETLDEAIHLLAMNPDEAKLLAGGHSLLPLMKLRLASPRLLIDLRRISGLRGIKQEGHIVTIGPLTTHYEIESSALLREKCPLLPQTAAAIGDVQVRNRGTIGGSLAHADPAADFPAALLALGAEVRLTGPENERWVRAEDFFCGLMTTALFPTEILTEIRIPILASHCGSAYVKAPQKASGFAIVGVASWLTINEAKVCEDLGIGVTGLTSNPFRARAAEEILRGGALAPECLEEAASRVTQGIDPLSDLHASGAFRSHLARLYTVRALRQAIQDCKIR
ncbi:MAG: xanthine dehydrogenase family protein subunit M [Deltaproteobacteria bacterium]|nr:xanthine dehydrogenase family protein subunit M [Deltaproteobacteria bacterium]